MTYAVAYSVTTSAYAHPSERIVLSGLESMEAVNEALAYSGRFGTVTNVTISTY